jgi:hypothetical protein
LAEETIIRRLALAKEQPDTTTQTFSTKQLLVAIYGDISAERLREVRERADNLSLKNRALRGELLERTELEHAGAQFMIAVKARIETSSMPKTERQALLSDLAAWPVTVVAETAQRQSRQLRLRPEKDEDGNGDGDGDPEVPSSKARSRVTRARGH